MEIIVHHSIADLYKTLQMPLEQDTDFTILSVPDIHPQIPFTSPVLRADYFSFILTKEGAGVYYLDDNKFPFHSSSIYFTNPGHIKWYELEESKEAYIITLTENFLTENVHADIYNEFPFLFAEIVPPKTLTTEKFKEFETLYTQILDEYGKSSLYKDKILGNLFFVLLLKLKEFWLDYNPRIEGTRNSQIVKSFKQLLESEFKKVMKGQQSNGKLQAQYFAERLNLHPNYLNSVIKSKTGKTMYEWITSRTLSTAKSLLKDPTLSAKEIAYLLGFSEPTHFTRFFKKHESTTPMAYRRNARSLK